MNREEEIQQVLEAVVNMSPDYYSYDMGAREYNYCPFCDVQKEIVGRQGGWQMKELPHRLDCAWLIARDLLTGIPRRARRNENIHK